MILIIIVSTPELKGMCCTWTDQHKLTSEVITWRTSLWWQQTTVWLDLDCYDQRAETWPASCGSRWLFRSVMDSSRGACVVPGKLKVIAHTYISVTQGCNFSQIKGLRSWPSVTWFKSEFHMRGQSFVSTLLVVERRYVKPHITSLETHANSGENPL